MPKPALSQLSADASAGLGEVLALLARLCRESDLGVRLVCMKFETGEA